MVGWSQLITLLPATAIISIPQAQAYPYNDGDSILAYERLWNRAAIQPDWDTSIAELIARAGEQNPSGAGSTSTPGAGGTPATGGSSSNELAGASSKVATHPAPVDPHGTVKGAHQQTQGTLSQEEMDALVASTLKRTKESREERYKRQLNAQELADLKKNLKESLYKIWEYKT